MPRRLQALGKGAPTVESRLDDFIERANHELADVDVSAFDKETQEQRAAALKAEQDQRDAIAKAEGAQRERMLEQRVEQLEQRLLAIKAKRKPSQGWGKLVIGFVLGCGAMFAVSALLPRDQAAPATATTAAPTTAPATTAPTTAAPTTTAPPPPAASIAVTPIEEPTSPAPAAAPPAAAPPAAAPPVAETPLPAEPVAAKPAGDKPPKKPRRPSTTQPTAKPQPAPDKGSGGEGLYNPF